MNVVKFATLESNLISYKNHLVLIDSDIEVIKKFDYLFQKLAEVLRR